MSDALINGLAGAGGGIIAQLITYPLQTVRCLNFDLIFGFIFWLLDIVFCFTVSYSVNLVYKLYKSFFWSFGNGEACMWWSFVVLGKYSATNRERCEEGKEETWAFGPNVSGLLPFFLGSILKFYIWPSFISQLFFFSIFLSCCVIKPMQIWLFLGCKARRVGTAVWRISSLARRHRCVSGELFFFFFSWSFLLFLLFVSVSITMFRDCDGINSSFSCNVNNIVIEINMFFCGKIAEFKVISWYFNSGNYPWKCYILLLLGLVVNN